MPEAVPMSDIEKFTQEAINDSANIAWNFDGKFISKALDPATTPAQIVPATQMITTAYAQQVAARAQDRIEDAQRRLLNAVGGLHTIASNEALAKKMPAGYGLAIADTMAAGLANEKLPDAEAGHVYNLTRHIIVHYGHDAKETGLIADRHRVAASLGRLASATAGRPDHYLNTAHLAVSHNLGIVRSDGINRIINGYAYRANPAMVRDENDLHVCALGIFAENSEDFVGCWSEEAPALYETLASFNEALMSVSGETELDEKTSRRRQGLQRGCDALAELTLFSRF